VPEDFTRVVARYEELLEIREQSIEQLKAERDRQASLLKQLQGAVAQAESDLASAKRDLKSAEHSRNAFPLQQQMEAEGSIRRILLLEPDAETGRIMASLLTHFGYEVTPVASSAEAASHLSCRGYDLLLAEVHDLSLERTNIPGDSGFRLGKQAAAKGVAAVALTVLDEPDDITQTLEAGYLAHIVKPTDIHAVLMAIRAVAAPKTPAGHSSSALPDSVADHVPVA
jgi:CheY-like chemotaxis protein